MSSASFSRYIPDLDLITYYAENQVSVLSRTSPWTRCCMVLFLILLVTVIRNIAILAFLYLIVIILYLSAGLPVKKLLLWYVLPILFVLSLVGILMWSEPGTVLFSIPVAGFILSLSDKGVILVVTLLLKALISVTFSLLFLMTTRYRHLSGIISRIFPAPLDQIFLLAYRFIFLTLSMTAAMLRAVRSRGGGLTHSLRMQAPLFAGIFALVFIRSFERGERVHKAMIARGFTGTFPLSGEVPRPPPAEYMLMVIAGALVIGTVLLPSGGGW
jgi:cobalt/nickel transport system permease protein